MAAHLDGKGVITQDAGGFGPEGGATGAISRSPTGLTPSTTQGRYRQADLVIGCDSTWLRQVPCWPMQPGRTFCGAEHHSTPTAAFVNNPDWQFPAATATRPSSAVVGAGGVGSFDAADAGGTQLLGDSIYTNPLMLGYAWQGPRAAHHASLMRAMELNGVQVENNKAAFEWGRRCAHDAGAVPGRASDPVRQKAVAGRHVWPSA